jgi:hypothetical protein
MHQVPAVKNRDPRKKLKRTVDQIIIVPDPADARIGMKTGNDGILKSFDGPGGKAAGQKSNQGE